MSAIHAALLSVPSVQTSIREGEVVLLLQRRGGGGGRSQNGPYYVSIAMGPSPGLRLESSWQRLRSNVDPQSLVLETLSEILNSKP